MRRAFNDTQWVFNDAGELLGFALGFDFCSEHEWGIKGIREAFLLENGKFPMGVRARKIHRIPQELRYLNFSQKPDDKRKKAEDYAMLGYGQYSWSDDPVEGLKEAVLREARPYGDKQIGAAWAERDFGICVKGDENINRLRELTDAFHDLDIAIAPGKSQGFLRSFGLTFVILSRVDQHTLDAVLEADKDHKALMEASDATGIVERLKKAQRGFYACSPRWADKEKSGVVYWLNPIHQHQYNAGWFTVQDLDDWIAGKGKVPK